MGVTFRSYTALLWILATALGAGDAIARDVLDLQPSKLAWSAKLSQKGAQDGLVELIQPNKNFSVWYLLFVRSPGSERGAYFHLENPSPLKQDLRLERGIEPSLVVRYQGKDHRCAPWKNGELDAARRVQKPFAEVCGGRLYLRNPTIGDVTSVEWAVDVLRQRVSGSEDLINLVKDTLYRDKFLIRGIDVARDPMDAGAKAAVLIAQDLAQEVGAAAEIKGPGPALVAKGERGSRVDATELGIRRANGAQQLVVGEWYQSALSPAVYVSAYVPVAVPNMILRSARNRVANLGGVERRAAVYLVAFDLGAYDVGYSLGTDHPEVTYSSRTASKAKVRGWKGPDGISSYAPFVSTGVLNPDERERIAAVFTGGFKRMHSVFRVGRRALDNGGHHYGFLQNGVVFSSLWPGLSTAYVDETGRFGMKTWTAFDDRRRAKLRFARQNGLPLVDFDVETQRVVPGRLIRDNFAGNWSGDKKNSIRTLRAGLCWQQANGRDYLIYGYFSSHTPSAMSRVFQSYDCRHAMHLDMNMLPHVYLAVHGVDQETGKWRSEYLIKEMHSRDVFLKNERVPRFVGAPDNRDFFYLTVKNPSKKPKPPTVLVGTKKKPRERVEASRLEALRTMITTWWDPRPDP